MSSGEGQLVVSQAAMQGEAEGWGRPITSELKEWAEMHFDDKVWEDHRRGDSYSVERQETAEEDPGARHSSSRRRMGMGVVHEACSGG